MSRSELLAVFVVSLLGAACGDGPFTIELTQADLQERLDARFPVEMEKLMTRVVLSDPKVMLEPGKDDIGLDLAVTVDLPLLDPRSGRIAASGDLSYKKDEKAFCLTNPKVRGVEIPGLDPAYLDKARPPIEAVATAAFEVFPVFELKKRNLKEVTAEHVLQKVYVRDGKLVAELGLGSSQSH